MNLKKFTEKVLSNPVQRSCYKCEVDACYSSRHDAWFCGHCKEWLEENCGDSECGYCVDRPHVEEILN